jgi:phosphatidate cytidylyltransferase
MFLWFFMTWQTDNGCLLFGRLFGYHKCAPVLSPSKSWEGVLGGWVLNYASLLLLHAASGDLVLPTLSSENMLHISLIVRPIQFAFSGQLGDLAESFFKRCAGVKDSGTLFPGHGGILDRLDSLVMGAPALTAYVYLYALG